MVPRSQILNGFRFRSFSFEHALPRYLSGESTIDPVVSFDCNTRFQQQSKLTIATYSRSTVTLTRTLGLTTALVQRDCRRCIRLIKLALAYARQPCAGQIWDETASEAASSKIRCLSTPYPSRASSSDPLGSK